MFVLVVGKRETERGNWTVVYLMDKRNSGWMMLLLCVRCKKETTCLNVCQQFEQFRSQGCQTINTPYSEDLFAIFNNFSLMITQILESSNRKQKIQLQQP